MSQTTQAIAEPQIPMPGMPRRITVRRVRDSNGLFPGQIVEYQGRIVGGPRFGLKGKVVETRVRQAVVDMGPAGTWHIPYHFLTFPLAA